mgnify:CR=1 FL=1
MMRDLYGTIDLSAPVQVVHTYQMSRSKLTQAIEIIEEIAKISPPHTLSAAVPVLSLIHI